MSVVPEKEYEKLFDCPCGRFIENVYTGQQSKIKAIYFCNSPQCGGYSDLPVYCQCKDPNCQNHKGYPYYCELCLTEKSHNHAPKNIYMHIINVIAPQWKKLKEDIYATHKNITEAYEQYEQVINLYESTSELFNRPVKKSLKQSFDSLK